MRPETAGVKVVTPLEARALIEDKKVYLIDVHVPEQTHIPGTNAFIPYDKITDHLDQLPTDKAIPILVYCRSGNMSRIASQELLKLGYQKVYDLSGGTNAYKEVAATVVITPPFIDLDQVIYGDVGHATFTLTNYTQNPLKITRVSTSCMCTKAKVAETEIAPYATTTIEVSFDPAVHKDDTDIGQITRTIYLDTDNPNFPQVTAKIYANVIKKNSQ